MTVFQDFASCKEELLRRGERFANMSLHARSKIAELGHSFIQDDCTLLVHGVSRVVTQLVLKAAETTHFNLILTESRPDSAG
jgi:translation initiation factor eIF-2B subunit alpha